MSAWMEVIGLGVLHASFVVSVATEVVPHYFKNILYSQFVNAHFHWS